MEVGELLFDPNVLMGIHEEKLRSYCHALAEGNNTVRLTGPRDEPTLWNEHLLDCLSLLPLLPASGTIVDVGTGGGLPGIVLAICRPDLRFTLIDSVAKKIVALTNIITALQLGNATACCIRSEDLAGEKREYFDCAVVRAVSEAGVTAEYLSPLVRIGGCLLAMKGPAVGEELAPISGKWNKLGLSQPKVMVYRLNEAQHNVVCWHKTAPCASVFPRLPGKAEHRLWWR